MAKNIGAQLSSVLDLNSAENTQRSQQNPLKTEMRNHQEHAEEMMNRISLIVSDIQKYTKNTEKTDNKPENETIMQLIADNIEILKR